MSKTTQCPSCLTRFKVSDVQLAAAQGLVRCGRCAHVFNATDHLVQPAAASQPTAAVNQPVVRAAPVAPAATPAASIDDFELEVPDFDPLSAPPPDPAQDNVPPQSPSAPSAEDVRAFQEALNQALQSDKSTPIGNPFANLPAEEPPADNTTGQVPATGPRPGPAPEVENPQHVPADLQRIEPEIDSLPHPPETDNFFDPAEPPVRKKRKNSALTITLILLASLFGLLLLAGQLVYLNRTMIASQEPKLRPALEKICHSLGCKVPYPTDQAYIRTEWSELSFVPDHPNLVQLAATLKNHAPYPQAYPMLEVTLKDADNQVLIRKVFTPAEYLRPEHAKNQAFVNNVQEKILMRFDVGKVHAQGYSLYWFYP